MYFNAYDAIHNSELWKSDGTDDGTVLVKDIEEGSDGSSPSSLVLVDGWLFFEAIDLTHGDELG